MKKIKQPEKYTDFDIKLAQRILCSTVSVQMGISYQHCWKTYIEPNLEGKEIGTLYLECAKIIRENVRANNAALFSGSVS